MLADMGLRFFYLSAHNFWAIIVFHVGTVINDYCHIDEVFVGNINFYEEKNSFSFDYWCCGKIAIKKHDKNNSPGSKHKHKPRDFTLIKNFYPSTLQKWQDIQRKFQHETRQLSSPMWFNKICFSFLDLNEVSWRCTKDYYLSFLQYHITQGLSVSINTLSQIPHISPVIMRKFRAFELFSFKHSLTFSHKTKL